MGRQTFERALADPQSLADMDYDAETAYYEGYQYVPTKVEEELGDGEISPRYSPAPSEPSGQSWDEDKVAQLFPKLVEKYDYNG